MKKTTLWLIIIAIFSLTSNSLLARDKDNSHSESLNLALSSNSVVIKLPKGNCGGVAVPPRYVITAAHCIYLEKSDSNLRGFVGIENVIFKNELDSLHQLRREVLQVVLKDDGYEGLNTLVDMDYIISTQLELSVSGVIEGVRAIYIHPSWKERIDSRLIDIPGFNYGSAQDVAVLETMRDFEAPEVEFETNRLKRSSSIWVGKNRTSFMEGLNDVRDRFNLEVRPSLAEFYRAMDRQPRLLGHGRDRNRIRTLSPADKAVKKMKKSFFVDKFNFQKASVGGQFLGRTVAKNLDIALVEGDSGSPIYTCNKKAPYSCKVVGVSSFVVPLFKGKVYFSPISKASDWIKDVIDGRVTPDY